jgi:hypothetical protein
MTLPTKPSSIVRTRAQVEAMAVWHEQEAWRFSRLSGFESAERHLASAAMLRELAGGVPVSELEALALEFEAIYHADVSNGYHLAAEDLRDLINQHRAST